MPNRIHYHFVGKDLSLIHNQQRKNVKLFFCQFNAFASYLYRSILQAER